MLPLDSTIWIVHRNSGARAALARVARRASGVHEIVSGQPEDAIFDAISAPANLVVLGLDASAHGADFEAELEFVRWALAKLPGSAWILIAEADDCEAARGLFDSVDAEFLVHPADRRSLLRAIDAGLRGTSTEQLSCRQRRDCLAARFARWFGRHEPPELTRALAAHHAEHPFLVRGEPGTGRGLLVRYAHAFSTGSPGPLLQVVCPGATRAEHLLAQLEDGVAEVQRASHAEGPGRPRAPSNWGIWLDSVDELPDALQRRVLDWIELGLPGGLVRGRVRWLASASEERPLARTPQPRLDVRLERAFSELQLETRPLRAQPEVIEAFVEDTARAWSEAHQQPLRSFDEACLEALRDEPWPGNIRELEATVIRTLAQLEPGAEPVRVADLRFEAGTAIQLEPEKPDESGAEPALEALAEAASEDSAGVGTPEEVVSAGEGASDTPRDTRRDAPGATHGSLQRLAAAVAHEVRNPLVSIRTLSELLPELYADEEFRSRFSRLVGDDVRRIEGVVERLQSVAEASTGRQEVVDLTSLLEELLDAERSRIQARRLLVLKELDRSDPQVLADPVALRGALSGLLGRALDEIPERGDLYVASRYHPAAAEPPDLTAAGPAGPTVRILLRYHVGPGQVPASADPSAPELRETVLEHAVAESVVRAQGGTLTVDNSDASETVIVIDLPAPPQSTPSPYTS